ncbi:hypothetical protein RYD26_09395 [Pasteurellaceae bacterium LIM206]|nr:hypothetical protein [Pasteurellaceae bacterium LIM206]
MKLQSKLALAVLSLGLFSTNAIAARLPAEIYKPADAEVVKADRQGDGEFEAEFRLKGDKKDIRRLAKRTIEHAQRHGFHVTEKELDDGDADLKFKRGDQELDVSIELKDHGRIEYKADLDMDRN